MRKSEPKSALISGAEWLTLPDALSRVESETGEELSEGLLLQRAGDGAIRLALRLDHAKGTPWSLRVPIQDWWRMHFTESSNSSDVVTLTGIFDLDLDEGGRHVIDMMRRRANGEPRPAPSLATLTEPRIKLTDESGASFALLCPAKTRIDGIGDAVIDRAYGYASGLSWPLPLARVETVIRSAELARVIEGTRGGASSARGESHSAGAEPKHANAVAAPTESATPDKALPWWQSAYNIQELAQNIGESLHAAHKPTSNTEIAKKVSARINEVERSKGLDRSAPHWDTVRGALTRWRFKPA